MLCLKVAAWVANKVDPDDTFCSGLSVRINMVNTATTVSYAAIVLTLIFFRTGLQEQFVINPSPAEPGHTLHLQTV